MGRLRVGWLAPEDCTLPPGEVGSLTTDIWQLVSRLSDRCDFVVATREHPALGAAELDLDGVRYVREPARADVRRGRVLTMLNQAERRLRLPDRPYAGRPSYYRGYVRAHARRLAGAGVDVLHLHNASQWVPVLRAELPDTPVVLQMHCEWLAEIPRHEGLERLGLVDRVLGVSAQIADQIRARYPERAHVVDVLPNGVDLEDFPPSADVRASRSGELEAMRARFGLRGGPVLLFVGRLSAEKGLHTLLESMPRVLASFPGAQLLLVGGRAGLRSPLPTRERRELAGHPEWRARYVEHLRRLAAPLGESVRFAGSLPVDDLPLVYALADLYVQPSVFEAFGLPVVEAMASGLPVVVSDGGALPELVRDGVTGRVFPCGDTRALADALLGVLADRTLAGRLGAAGREEAVHRFDWDAAAAKLLRVYEDVVGERARDGARAATPSGRRPTRSGDTRLRLETGS